MRCLILLIITNLIYITVVLETVWGQGYGFILNFSLIPVITAVLFFSVYESLLLIAVSSILALSLIILGVSLHNIIETLLYLVFASAAGYYLKYMTRHVLDWKNKVLEVIKEEHRSFYDFNKKAQNDKNHLEKALYDIHSLYEAPKKMISTTTLEGLLNSLKGSIRGYFTFTNCKVIIFYFKEKEPGIDKVYNISEKDNEDNKLSGYEDSLVETIKGTKGALVIDRTSALMPPGGLNIPEEIDKFIAVPLIVGDRFNGIFCAEGILLDDMLRFIILAHQFAMVLERIRLYELVQELAITDGLTGLFVRRHFLERLGNEIERAKYFNTRLSFIMIDIDHFKRYNDKYGHLVGDVVLQTSAAILKKSLRDIDIIGRYGGEEFSVILPETAKDSALIAGERLRKAVEGSQINAYDESINITVSMGITTFPDDADDLNQLIDKADQMLYMAKENGRNKIKAYEK